MILNVLKYLMHYPYEIFVTKYALKHEESVFLVSSFLGRHLKLLKSKTIQYLPDSLIELCLQRVLIAKISMKIKLQ